MGARQGSMAMAGRSRTTLKSLSPRALRATERFQQPQRARRHPRTQFGMDVPGAAGCCEWAERTPGYGPFPHTKPSLKALCRLLLRWEWLGRFGATRNGVPLRPKITARLSGQLPRSALMLRTPPCRRRMTASPKATPR